MFTLTTMVRWGRYPGWCVRRHRWLSDTGYQSTSWVLRCGRLVLNVGWDRPA